MARKPRVTKKKAATPARGIQDLTVRQGWLLAHISEPVMIFEFAAGTLLYWNPAAEETYGYTAAEALGRNIHELLQTTPEVQTIRADVERHGRWSGELTHRRRNGARVDVEARIVLVRDPDGTMIAVETTRDAGERKVLIQALRDQTEELLAADRNRNEFLAVLAHELRNPLGALRNIAQVLRTPAALGDLERARVIMNRQIQNMARMIDDLLDVARVAHGQIELHWEPVDLQVVLERAVEAARAKIDERGQRLSLSLTDAPLYLEGDVTRLEQVFVNLLSNAVKFTNPGGHIWLTTEVLKRPARAMAESGPRRRYPQVVVRLRDDGVGIVPAVLPRVFDILVQAERSPERMEGGLGLGLMLVRRVVELHGGTVDATSSGLGMGSEFTVRLPLSPVLVGETPGPDAASAPRGPAASRRVLVVDDDPDTAESLGLMLGEEGHDVRVAHDPEAALAAIAEFRPQFAILDIALPGMDGYALAAALLARPGLGKLRLVALTGFDQKVIDPGGTKGKIFDRMLEKPVDPDVLRDILQGE